MKTFCHELLSDAYQQRLSSFGLSVTASLSATVGLLATVSGLIGNSEWAYQQQLDSSQVSMMVGA